MVMFIAVAIFALMVFFVIERFITVATIAVTLATFIDSVISIDGQFPYFILSRWWSFCRSWWYRSCLLRCWLSLSRSIRWSWWLGAFLLALLLYGYLLALVYSLFLFGTFDAFLPVPSHADERFCCFGRRYCCDPAGRWQFFYYYS